MGTKCVLGPVLSDLEDVGLAGQHAVIATAFYTKGPLQNLRIQAERLTLLVRLDLNSIEEWARGSIAPDALAEFVRRLSGAGIDVKLFVSRLAHAKAYLGQHGFLVGSANLTSRGFSGIGSELLWGDTSAIARERLAQSLRRYRGGMSALSLSRLEQYVETNTKAVNRLARRVRTDLSDESRVHHIDATSRPTRLGDYDDFLRWLLKRPRNEAAQEIHARGMGKNNLSGHIYRSFYGIRQFLLSDPKLMNRFRVEDANAYRLSADQNVEQQMADFVNYEAADEEDFVLDTWRSYLPKECGGRAGAHGGTIGNLNRMLPLVAHYISERMRRT